MTPSSKTSKEKQVVAQESEFGSGLALCLVKFAEHFENELAERLYQQQHDKQFSKHDFELWANGASDHLYDLKVPKKWAKTAFGRKVNSLRDKGLEIGHGFTGKEWTFEDFAELLKLTREIAHLLDVGLWAMLNEKTQLDLGQW